jgi:hypothetical protein
MVTRTPRTILFALTLLAGALPAFAQPTQPPAPTDPTLPGTGPGTPVAPMGMPGPGTTYSTATWPTELTARPVVLGIGMLEIRGDLFFSLSKNDVGDPTAITPAVYYGLSDQLTLGIFEDRFCFGDSCVGVFDSLGLDAIFALLTQMNLQLAVRGALVANSFENGLWQLRVGALGKFFLGQLAIQFDPKLLIGLNKGAANREYFSLPVDVQYQIDAMLALFLTIGVVADLDYSDYFHVPVGFGAHYTLTRQIDLAGQLLFLNLLGKTPGYGPLDARALQLFVNYRI